ncbi:hypothetical protein Sste5346_004646 [Sporothrix stenoceras]|uniref:Manganese/iron superoxide dismutase C-terminal domain-containing protein n=1 Tax=Sporothrix stenoceras TaxID=5173 RepID=A0ABR3Z7G4_9PEZI
MFRPRLRTPAAFGGIISSGASSLLARQSAQTALAPLSQALRSRSIHNLPVSRHDAYAGVPNLLSAEGYDLAWTQHMSLMLNRLNQLTAGTEYENLNLKTVVQETARFPHLASTFNHASMALNTDFFFKQLLPASQPGAAATPSREIPSTLRAAIEDNFSSVETLRLEFAAIAAGMFGPGFIWLVKANNLHQSGRGGDNLRLLTTYHAGSPFPGAHYRRQAVDMNNVGAETAEGNDPAAQWLADQGRAASYPTPPTQPGAPATYPQQVDKRPPGGVEVIPLLCLSTWEHVWLRDYGLGADGYGGKAAYVDAWWKAIDWQAVDSLANLTRPKLKV